MTSLPEIIFIIATTYVGVGFLFSILFVILGVHLIDPGVKGATPGFRIVIIPGLIIFWPLFALKWKAKSQPPVEKSKHRVR